MYHWLPAIIHMKIIYTKAVYACFFNLMKYFTDSYGFVCKRWPLSNSEIPTL